MGAEKLAQFWARPFLRWLSKDKQQPTKPPACSAAARAIGSKIHDVAARLLAWQAGAKR